MVLVIVICVGMVLIMLLLNSCVELPVHKILMGIAADLGLTLYRGDDTDDYAHYPAPSKSQLVINEAYVD